MNTMNGELIIQNLIPNLQQWWDPIRIIGILIGFILVASGLTRSVSNHGSHQGSAKTSIVSIVSGILLINVMQFLNVMTQTLLAKSSETGLSYAPPGGNDPTALYIQFAVYVVMLVGLSGVVYGGVLLKRSAEDVRQVGPAITHIAGGTFGVNIVAFLHVIATSMGPTVNSAITKLIG